MFGKRAYFSSLKFFNKLSEVAYSLNLRELLFRPPIYSYHHLKCVISKMPHIYSNPPVQSVFFWGPFVATIMAWIVNSEPGEDVIRVVIAAATFRGDKTITEREWKTEGNTIEREWKNGEWESTYVGIPCKWINVED